MTAIEIKPSQHHITATETQVGWLNELSGANARYRRALESLGSSVERELLGTTFWGIPATSLNEVVKYEGALNAILNMKGLVFVGVEYEKVTGWVQTALEPNPHGMNGANVFHKTRG